jgi:hypothetical protein
LLKKNVLMAQLTTQFCITKDVTPFLLDICLYWAVKMLKPQISLKVSKLPSTEEILCTTGFYKVPGFPQRSQIKTNIKRAGSLLRL